MKLEPETIPGERNTATSIKFDDDFMMESCDDNIFFLIYGQFVFIREEAGFRTHGL